MRYVTPSPWSSVRWRISWRCTPVFLLHWWGYERDRPQRTHRLLSLVNQLLDFRKVEEEHGDAFLGAEHQWTASCVISERFEPSISQQGGLRSQWNIRMSTLLLLWWQWGHYEDDQQSADKRQSNTQRILLNSVVWIMPTVSRSVYR